MCFFAVSTTECSSRNASAPKSERNVHEFFNLIFNLRIPRSLALLSDGTIGSSRKRTQSRQTHRVACRHVGAHCRSRHYGRRDDCNKRGATARGHLYCDAEVGQEIDFKRENPRKPSLNAAAESLRRLDDSNHISTVVSTVVSGVGLTNVSTGGCCVSSSASHVSATSFIRRS